MNIRTRPASAVWRLLLRAQLREQPGRLAVAVLAIALGVALGTAVYLVNDAALEEFSQAARRLTGDADLLVQGAPAGFDESVFVALARDPRVAEASPVLDLQMAVAGQRLPLHLLGVDPFRAAGLQPALFGATSFDVRALLAPDAMLLSSAAAETLGMHPGSTLTAVSGSRRVRLRVVGVLPAGRLPQPLAVMDIASAQWAFAHLGLINRVDLRLRDGQDVRAFQTGLAARLPAGVQASAPQLTWDRARTVTRAYRVNLNMLALVTLLTGAFLVFATQSLSALRRRTEFALLRALGLTAPELERVLVGEGALLGAVGSLLGVVLGVFVAGGVLLLLSGDFGNGQLQVNARALPFAPLPMLAFFLMGTATACLGSYVPAREAARRAPALALKTGDAEQALGAGAGAGAGVTLVALGAGLAWLPPVAGLPLPGYAAIAALLLGAVLLLPAAVRQLLGIVPHTGRLLFDLAIAQLRGSVGLATASLATIVVSFSLMIAMAIMVHSFRSSFEGWLTRMLPADLQLRVPPDSDTAGWSLEEQARITALPGVRRAQFRRLQPVFLAGYPAPVTLIARDGTPAALAAELPLVTSLGAVPAGVTPVWISEVLHDRAGYRIAGPMVLPLAGRAVPCVVAGIWRDYARPDGAIVMPRAAYRERTGDSQATEGAVWIDAAADAARVVAAIRGVFAAGEAVEITSTPAVRTRSLAIFDRAFAITYGLEAIAVAIGLLGVSVAASATVFARRTQFGMLRHIGMCKAQVLGMLGQEGLLLSGMAVSYGLVLGAGLSLVLVYVVNRQSFSWSIDLAVPWGRLAALSATLLAAASFTAVLSGRGATGRDVIRAVREDW